MNVLTPVLNHLWQSTLFAAAIALLTLLFRDNRARVRHALWLTASCKFLLPFSLLIAMGGRIHWQAPAAPTSNLSTVVEQVSTPFTFPAPPHVPAPAPAADPLPFIFFGVWAVGSLALALTWLIRWRRMAIAVRQGATVELPIPIPARACPTWMEPGIFGIWQPLLILPAGIVERLTPSQLDVLIAHELHHVRRRDNFIAAFQMSIETIFWFHPLVWWIGKRMIEERERACDEAVLGAGNEPRVYAEAILNVCKWYTESPLVCVSGVTGANLKKRIEGIMTQRLIRDLTVARKLVLAAAGVAAIASPIAIGMLHAPRALAQAVTTTAPPVTPPPVVKKGNVRISPPVPVAMAPFVAQGPVQSAEEARAARAEYLKVHPFTNTVMNGVYRTYGPPDQKIAFISGPNELETWRYNNIPAFHGNVEFEFVTNAKQGVRINYPPPAGVFVATSQDSAGASTLAQALHAEMKLPAPANDQFGQLPGVKIETQLLYGVIHLTSLTVPLNTYSSEVDVIGQVLESFNDGSKDMAVANFRDKTTPQATYRTQFVVLPGTYRCNLLVRERSNGLMYTATIPFEVTR